MGRYTQARCRLCRREGMKLFLKGVRCNTEKCSFSKRPYAPGFHGKSQTKQSYYAIQLREKQKVKRIYGMMEKQFRRFFQLASKTKGATGGVLIQLLERRLDNVIFRALCAYSRSHARQFVNHGHVMVNNRRVTIPSYLVKPADVIEIKSKPEVIKSVKEIIETCSKERSIPEWITFDKNKLRIEINRLPIREDVILPVNEQLIVELYSK